MRVGGFLPSPENLKKKSHFSLGSTYVSILFLFLFVSGLLGDGKIVKTWLRSHLKTNAFNDVNNLLFVNSF